MAFVDIPVEQLPLYEGKNPCPGDFDAFWDRGLEEIRALDARVELVPAPFNAPYAECFDMWFTGTVGARLHAKLLRPRGAANGNTPGPAALRFHGYYGSAGEWFETLGYAAAGFTVASLDVRGQGGRSSDPGGAAGPTIRGQLMRGIDGPPEQLLLRHVMLDTALLARLVMEMPWVDPDRVGAFGASQGGALTIACAALEPRIRRAAPVFPFLADYRQAWELDLSPTMDGYGEIKNHFRNFDPLHERKDEVFTKLGYIDIQHLAPRIRASVMMATALRDTTCPPSTQYAVYNRITSEKNMITYPDFAHEALPGMMDRTFEFLLGL